MKHIHTLIIALLLATLGVLQAADKPAQPARPDIFIADFEQGYGDWTVKGEAFNHPTTPVSGATGFVGKGLADSWDPSKNNQLSGSLTSPVFTIERNFIRFLVAGRGFSPKSSLQLLIDGKLEFYATGVLDRKMRLTAFDVSAFLGRKAQLVVSDKGTWEFVAVDEIVASDTAGQGAKIYHPMSQCVAVDNQMDLTGMRYLTLPINNLAPVRDFVLEVDGQRRMNLSLPLAIDAPADFWASYPLEGGLSGQELKGQKLRFYNSEPVVFKQDAEKFLKQISLSTQPRDMDGVYQEPGRPQLSFTVKRGNNADPNGQFFYEGLWHMFYQYNPVGLFQAAHWGHATSPDLFHWTEQDIAIRHGIDWKPFSGCGVVDHNNDSGLKQGTHPPILLFFSKNGLKDTGLAFSVDGGKTFREYEKNPLFLTRDFGGHDPKVVWYVPEKKWVMIIHDMKDKVWGFDFYESKNLLDWKYLSTSPGWFEVPNLFALPLDGDRSKIKWMVSEVSNTYKIGDFNGREFIPETEKMKMFNGNFGCPQNFDNAPDGRCIMMGNRWGGQYSKDDPTLHIGGGMNIPVDVTLRTSPTGPRLYLNPVKEIEKLVSQKHDFKNVSLSDLSAKLNSIKPDLFDIEFEWDSAQQKDFQLNTWDRNLFAFNAKDMTYSVDGKMYKVTPVNGTIKVRLIIDRSLVSFYINDGYEAGNCYLGKFTPECKQALSLSGDAGQAFKSFRVNVLRPTWNIKK
jgi:sucrose-6-phosphate hydrolase SacC (GH32 family)